MEFLYICNLRGCVHYWAYRSFSSEGVFFVVVVIFGVYVGKFWIIAVKIVFVFQHTKKKLYHLQYQWKSTLSANESCFSFFFFLFVENVFIFMSVNRRTRCGNLFVLFQFVSDTTIGSNPESERMYLRNVIQQFGIRKSFYRKCEFICALSLFYLLAVIIFIE